ncbi:MAG: hypothetical protein ACYCZX_19360 [Rhodospirillaceae bacterium]
MQQPTGVASVEPAHYVDWCSIAGGAVVAAAVSVVLITFGTAVGLSMVSPYPGEGVSRAVYAATLGLWTLWVVVSSFMAGGYVAGRMRRRIGDATEHEVEVRDGVHGAIVWATGIVLASLLLAAGVSGMVGTVAKAGASAGGAAAAGSRGGMTDFTVDSLFRAPATAADGAALAPAPGDIARERAEVGRIMTFGLKDGSLSADNRVYIARLVASRTGMSQADAEKRVDQVIADVKAAADAARKASVVVGFVTAAALLIGAAAAAWAATLGGRHRDQGADHSAFWRWPA